MTPIKIVARAGYLARGVVYLVVGALAALAAFDQRGAATDSEGALSVVMGAPFGTALLAALALGLLCYAGWRLVQAVLDADCHGRSPKGIVIRSALVVSAITHASLAFVAANQAFGWGVGTAGDGESSQEWTAWLLSQPYGQWLVGIVGATIVGVAIAHFVKAWTASFERRLLMSSREREVITPISRLGLASRGVAFLIIGGFFVNAGLRADPREAGGLREAFLTLQEQALGDWLLAALAFGLMAFGIYSLIEAFYRRIALDG